MILFRSFVVEAGVYIACFLPLVILIVLMLWVLSDNAKVSQPVADTVANEVANKPVVTETEVYKVVCTSDGEGYCKEYSVRRITKE